MRLWFRCLNYLSLSGALLATFSQAMAQQVPKLQLTALEPKIGTTTPGTKVKVYGEGFSTETVVYFGGLQARETSYVSPTTLEVVTPYLRPGTYELQLKSGESIVRSDVTFADIPATADSDIDHAVTLAGHAKIPAAIAILTNISKFNPDPQVRAFGHYQAGQIYFAQGDWWRWGGEAAAVFEPEAGRAVQTWWRYRLSYDESTYFLPIESDPDTSLTLADDTIDFDVTQNPEPHFFRGLINSRFGNLTKAKADADFILLQEPNNPSYRALAAYIAALNGDKTPLHSFLEETITDVRALTHIIHEG